MKSNSMNIFELSHIYYIFEDTPCFSKKNLGFFSTKKTLMNAINYYRELPGFCNAPNGFVINQRTILGDIVNGCVFEGVVYAHSEDHISLEFDMSIGLYAEYSTAQKDLNVFIKDNPYLFNDHRIVVECMVCESQLDEVELWKEGFVVEGIGE